MILYLWGAFCRSWIDPEYQREIGVPQTISREPAQWTRGYKPIDPDEITERRAREHVEHHPSRFK